LRALIAHGKPPCDPSTRLTLPASTASRPAFHDDRDTPLQGDETAWSLALIFDSEKQNIFSYGAGQPKSHQI
jgi:hypothetical protein